MANLDENLKNKMFFVEDDCVSFHFALVNVMLQLKPWQVSNTGRVVGLGIWAD